MNFLLLITGISSGFFHSIYSAVSKSLLKNRIKEPFQLFLYINIFQAISTPILWLFVTPSVPPISGWPPLLISGLTCIIAYLFLYMALSSGDASSVMPILGSKVMFAGFLAVIFLQEKHNWAIYCAAVVVAISIGLLSYSPSNDRKVKFPLRPILFMIICSIGFAFTDIFISRTLQFIDPYNFMVFYNLIIGLLSVGALPYIKKKNVAIITGRKDLLWSFISAIALICATLLLVISFEIADGVVIPNILISTRGVFIVLISAVLTLRGSTLLETQTRKIYILRLVASSLIILSIWIVLGN